MSYKRKEVIGSCELYLGDCLEVMPNLEKVQCVIVDPPFGMTACNWDVVIPYPDMWQAIDKIAGEGMATVIFGCEPFSSFLRMSNIKNFRYDWIWDKPKGTGFFNAKKQPLRCHEIISVFCAGQTKYYPQMSSGHVRKRYHQEKSTASDVYGTKPADYFYDSTERYPRSVITFSSETQTTSQHPTQKPLALMEYLVMTYSGFGDTVLDFTMGSGTTGIAALRQGRRFIGVEKEEQYFDVACRRIESQFQQPDMFSG